MIVQVIEYKQKSAFQGKKLLITGSQVRVLAGEPNSCTNPITYKKPIQPRELADQLIKAMDERQSRVKPVAAEPGCPAPLVEKPDGIEIDVIKEKRAETATAKEKPVKVMPVEEKADIVACKTSPESEQNSWRGVIAFKVITV